MLFPNVSALKKLVNNFFSAAPGDSQDYLQIIRYSDGAIIGWVDEAGIPRGSLAQGGGSGGGFIIGISPQSSSFGPIAPGIFCPVTTGTNILTALLPDATVFPLAIIIIKKVDIGIGSVIVTPFGGQIIDGLSTYTLVEQWQYIGVLSDGANWQIFTRN